MQHVEAVCRGLINTMTRHCEVIFLRIKRPKDIQRTVAEHFRILCLHIRCQSPTLDVPVTSFWILEPPPDYCRPFNIQNIRLAMHIRSLRGVASQAGTSPTPYYTLVHYNLEYLHKLLPGTKFVSLSLISRFLSSISCINFICSVIFPCFIFASATLATSQTITSH
jgi:hypothetical protein